MYMNVYESVLGSQKKLSDPPELELWAVMRTPGTELGSSERLKGTLNCRATSLGLVHFCHENM